MDMQGFSVWPRDTSTNGTRSDGTMLNTQGVIKTLVLDNSLQVRTSTMVTAAFNTVAAAVIILTVVYDAWKSWKRDKSYGSAGRFEFLRTIHPAEVFPLVIAGSIVMQGFIVLGVQGIGLNSIWVGNCRTVSQIVWPAIWIVPETLLVFSIEVALRALKRQRFGARGRWNTPICWSIVVILLISTWIPSHVRPAKRDECLGSLIWWASFWADFGVVINSVIIVLYVLAALIITIQLYRTAELDREERIAASRTVYYLAVGALLMSMVLPFWAKIVQHKIKETGQIARLAAIAVNIFGIVISILHLLLRSNAENMAIRPRTEGWSNNRGWRFFGSTDLDLGEHITGPVGLERENSLKRLVGEKRSPFDPGNARLQYYRNSPQDRNTNPLAMSPPNSSPRINNNQRHSRKRSHYTLYPASPGRSASSVYADDEDTLNPPKASYSRKHRRESSEFSSATVQIGLRLSHAALTAVGHSARNSVQPLPTSPTRSSTKPGSRPSNLRNEMSRSTTEESIELPIQAKLPNSRRESQDPLHGPTQSLLETLQAAEEQAMRWRKERGNKAERDAKMKTLPPIPATPQSMQGSQMGSPPPQRTPDRPSRPDEPSKRDSAAWPLRQPSGPLLPNLAYTPPPPGSSWNKNDWI
ncbi:MAG: hypothetical protein Q9227_007538 [Pyrenula ochraceoflavens]